MGSRLHGWILIQFSCVVRSVMFQVHGCACGQTKHRGRYEHLQWDSTTWVSPAGHHLLSASNGGCGIHARWPSHLQAGHSYWYGWVLEQKVLNVLCTLLIFCSRSTWVMVLIWFFQDECPSCWGHLTVCYQSVGVMLNWPSTMSVLMTLGDTSSSRDRRR